MREDEHDREDGEHEARTAHGRIISESPIGPKPEEGGIVRDPGLVSVVGLALPLAVAVVGLVVVLASSC